MDANMQDAIAPIMNKPIEANVMDSLMNMVTTSPITIAVNEALAKS